MENIFYVVLALHIAGKPINRENIRSVLRAAGTEINETALEAMAAFVESLMDARQEKERPVDPRIVKFLTSELAQRKVQTRRLEALLDELTELNPPSSKTGIRVGSGNPVEQEEPSGPIKPATGSSVAGVESITGEKGRYVYGISAGKQAASLGEIGIEGNEVYTIPCQGLCAIVHNCPTEPYQSDDDEIVKGWVRDHQNVLDAAKERFGTIIPLGFDTILQPQAETGSPNQVVKNWLKEDYDRLYTVMERVDGKDEYGVQISYESDVIGGLIAQRNERVKALKEEMETKSPGLEYMYRQKLEDTVRSEMEQLADEWFKEFYGRIERHSEDIDVNKTKRIDKNKVMLLNLSCLVAEDKVDDLGEELEEIDNMEGLSVRFTGPWPPYSFVANPTTAGDN
jgi:hypothetical protein